jgi:hypothetical protein
VDYLKLKNNKNKIIKIKYLVGKTEVDQVPPNTLGLLIISIVSWL